MNDKELTSKGKMLALLLRHKPELFDIILDDQGWALVNDIIKKTDIEPPELDEIVARDNKGRFEYNADKSKIRACQGHSIDVDLKLEPKYPPVYLYHGTSDRFIDSIKKFGLKPQSRQYVHLSPDKETAKKVGARHGGKTIILIVRAEEYHDNGGTFYLSNNGVWLAKEVPYKYIDFLKETP